MTRRPSGIAVMTLVFLAAACTTSGRAEGPEAPTGGQGRVPQVRLFGVDEGLTEACRYSAASAEWRALCPTALPRPFVGSPPITGAGINLTRRPPAISIGYGAPTEGHGSLTAANLWRNRPCCFLHLDVQLEHVYGPPLWRPVDGAAATLGGRPGWLQPPSGADYASGEYWGNHWRFFFAEAGEHYVVTLHDFGPDTRALLADIVAGLQPVAPLPSPLPKKEPQPCDTLTGTTLCGRGPVSDVVVSQHFVWEARPEADALVRHSRGEWPGRVITARYGDELLAASGRLWALAWKRNDMPLLQINPFTARIVRTIGLGRVSAGDLGVGYKSVWVSDDWRNVVIRVDKRSGRITARIPVGHGASAIVARGRSGVWVANVADGTVSHIDPATDEVTSAIAVGAYPQAIVPYDGDVWVAVSGEDALARIDGDTHEVVARTQAGTFPSALFIKGRCLWVAAYGDDRVRCHDPDTGAPKSPTFRAGPGPFALAPAQDTLWIATQEGLIARPL